MLELIFQGYIEWTYGLVLECWEYFSSMLLDIMSMDFAYLETHIPVIGSIMDIMLAIGLALLIGNLAFQATKSMLSGLGFEGEDPKLLFTRTFVFAFLLFASPQICKACLNLTSAVIELLELPDAVDIKFADEASFVGLNAAWLLVIICGVIVMFQSFKLIIEMAERYFILAVLTICAPLAFGVGGSRNTSSIFSGWCRMFASMCLMMVMNVVFVKMLLSVLSFYPCGLDVLPWMVLVLTVVKVAKKIDAIITRIGLNPAITGDSLGRTFPGGLSYMVVRTASSQIAKTIGKNAGGSGDGGTEFTPPSGPDGKGPFAGAAFAGAAAGTAGAVHTATGSQQQTKPSGQGDTPRRGIDVYPDEPAFTGSEYPAGTSPINSQRQYGGLSEQKSRKSAVPPGTHRPPSHLKTMDSPSLIPGTAGKPAMGTRGASPGANPERQESAAQGSTASSGTATRFSHVSSQRVHGTVQTAEQGAVSREHTHSSGVPQSEPPASIKAPGTAGTPPVPVTGQTAMQESRYSRNPAAPSKPPQTINGATQASSERQEPRPSQTTVLPSVSGASPQLRPGTAESGSPADVKQAATSGVRYGRNPAAPSATASPTVDRPQVSPVQQEAAKPPGISPTTVKGLRIDSRPGVPGTAPDGPSALPTRQTARPKMPRAMPTQPGGHGMKKPSGMSEPGETKETRKTAPKPPKETGGSGHG